MKGFLHHLSISLAIVCTTMPTLANEPPLKPLDRATTPATTSKMAARTTQEPAAIVARSTFKTIANEQSNRVRRATAAEAASVPTIYGTLVQASYGSAAYNAPGVYEIPSTDSDDFEIIASGIDAKYGATLLGNVLYVPTQEDAEIFGIFYGINKYDASNDFASLGSNSVSNDHFKSRCTAPDPTQENICYGCFYNGDRGYNFSKVNYSTRQETVIKAISTQWQICGINAQGELYAIDSSKKLYSVDKSTGEQTLLTTLDNLYLSGWNAGVFDLKTGLWYISSSKSWNGTKAALYSLDVSTFELVKIREYDYGETFTCMFIPSSGVQPNAPGAPSDLEVDFPEGSLTGTVSFTMPSNYYDGSAASGAFHYSVAIDGIEAANGMEVAGGTVSVQVTVDTEGIHKFEVSCFNTNGSGPKLKTSLYVGKDAPLAVENVTASYDGETVHLSWTPAAGSVNGGYVDPAATTYTITRQPGAFVIADGITATEFDTPITAPEGEITSFTFEVVATYDGRSSQPTASNPVVVGNLEAPHAWTFDTSDALAACTIINANNDNYTWALDTYNKCVKIRYNTSLAMDDWFVTEPIRLQGAHQYTLSFDVKASSATYSEHLEVFYGSSNTVDGMSNALVEKFEIANNTYQTTTVKFTPEADGIYYLGFHGCSAKDRNNLFLSNINISAGAAPVAPSAVTELSAIPDANGYKSVAVAFRAPSTNVDGSSLDACNIIVKRNGETAKIFDGVAAGELVEFTDTPELGGETTYSVTPLSNGLEGETASVTVFVGLKTPKEVTNITVTETATDGLVNVAWSAPDADIEGNTINADLVCYNVYFTDGESDFVKIGEGIEGTTISHTVNDGTSQSLALYLVEAVTDGGRSAAVASEAVAVGKAFTLPYADSFAIPNEYIYGTRHIKGTSQWMTLDDYTVDIVESADGDNAFLAVQQTGSPAISEFFTGKISLAGVDDPYLSFYTFNILDDTGTYPDLNAIDVMIRTQNGWSPLRQVIVNETGPALRWNKVFVPLSAYAGQSVQLALRVTSNTYQLTFFDALRIGGENAHNLTVEQFIFPGEIYAGADTDFDVVVANNGMNHASGYQVSLKIDGATAYTITNGETINAGHKSTHTFSHRFDVTDNSTHTIEAVATHPDDLVDDDNTSGVCSFTIEPAHFPVPADLVATVDNGKVHLQWSAPDMTSARPDPTTEDFEGYEGFDRNPSPWIMVDNDGGAIGGIRNITIPGIAAGSQQSFWVNEATEDVYGTSVNTFVGHNSAKSLMQMYVTTTDANGDVIPCDDWAISPELNGCKQTVGLWARSYSYLMPESFEILYSTGSTDPESFTMVSECKNIPAQWTHYSAQLPEGARRMAVRCTSRDKFSLLVDDITFIPAQGATALSLTGYQVHCNGTSVGHTSDTFFETNAPEAGTSVDYTVTAHYDKGISAHSNSVSVSLSAIDGYATASMTVSTLPGHIRINAPAGTPYNVVTPSGVTLACGTLDGTVSLPVPSGIYLVTAGTLTRKVAVE